MTPSAAQVRQPINTVRPRFSGSGLRCLAMQDWLKEIGKLKESQSASLFGNSLISAL